MPRQGRVGGWPVGSPKNPICFELLLHLCFAKHLQNAWLADGVPQKIQFVLSFFCIFALLNICQESHRSPRGKHLFARRFFLEGDGSQKIPIYFELFWLLHLCFAESRFQLTVNSCRESDGSAHGKHLFAERFFCWESFAKYRALSKQRFP
jgi:hypothetical protein